jgi:hypothetical protein
MCTPGTSWSMSTFLMVGLAVLSMVTAQPLQAAVWRYMTGSSLTIRTNSFLEVMSIN